MSSIVPSYPFISLLCLYLLEAYIGYLFHHNPIIFVTLMMIFSFINRLFFSNDIDRYDVGRSMRSGLFGGIEAIAYQLTMTSSGLKEYIWCKLIYSIVVGLLSSLKADTKADAEKEDRRKRFIQVTTFCFLFQIWKYWILTFQQSGFIGLDSSIFRVLAVALVGGLIHPVSFNEGFILQGFKYFLYYEWILDQMNGS